MQTSDALKPALRSSAAGINTGITKPKFERGVSGASSVQFALEKNGSGLPENPAQSLEKADANSSRALKRYGSSEGALVLRSGIRSHGSGSALGSENVERLRKSFSNVSETRSAGPNRMAEQPIGSKILGGFFSPWGIFMYLRLAPLLLPVLYVLTSFCPGSSDSSSICGDPKFNGIYFEYPVLSLISLAIMVVVYMYLMFESSEYWISVIEDIRTLSLVRVIVRALGYVVDTVQPSADSKVDMSPIFRPLAVLFYGLFAPLLLLNAEVILLAGSPLSLSPHRFFADYEIFRTIIVGTILSVLGSFLAVLAIASNSLSIIGIALLAVSLLLLATNMLYIWQYARDDESEFIVAFINNCAIGSSIPKFNLSEQPLADGDERAGDCPFYRTMRFRPSVDFRHEGELRDFQIVQLIRNLKVNPRLTSLYFSANNKLPIRMARIMATQLQKPGMIVNRVNDHIRPLNQSEAIILTPDVDRARATLSTIHDHSLRPWNNEIKWTQGLPWAPTLRTAARGATLFPFTGCLAINLANPDNLRELDLGSNRIGDELADDLTQLIAKSKKLYYLEIGGNFFTKSGIDKIVKVLINHPTIQFVRLSTVLIPISELRSSAVLDISLPRMYQNAVNRCVDSLFDSCSKSENLMGSTNKVAFKLPPAHEKVYLGLIHEVAAKEYRLVGRELYRSVPPELAKQCIRRVAHRLGKYQIEDPHGQLELPPDRCVDASVVKLKDMMENRLYTCFLHSDFDVMLISRMIDVHNTEIEELDLRGMPLDGEGFRMILNAVTGKERLRSVNFSYCGILDTTCTQDVINFIIRSSETLIEVNLQGNRAFDGQKDHIWATVSNSEKQNTPRIIVDSKM
jgi:hypothetical protein